MITDTSPPNRIRTPLLRRVGGFTLRVLRNFHGNQGLLLAGAVAYYTLLSIVPLFTLILVGLSHFLNEEQLIQSIARNLDLLVPGYADSLANQVRMFLARRHLVGAVGFVIMLFFSSMTFSVLESTMAVIFSHRKRSLRRPFFISAIIPYVYILLTGFGLLLVTLISGMLDALEHQQMLLLGYEISLKGSSKVLLYLMGMGGMVLMLTSFYLVMPVGRISFRHALSGAITAAVLWEFIRRLLVWYYSRLSLVNLIYGSLATTVVALLSIEVAVIILLLGAQVISEFDRHRYEASGNGPPTGGHDRG
ncbi:MAG: YihY/virulence factor BrkB family protein [Desulfobacterales bacterium]|nr:YihY/virulence factor BrkB family protein [Desulfobacterales bacterium]